MYTTASRLKEEDHDFCDEPSLDADLLLCRVVWRFFADEWPLNLSAVVDEWPLKLSAAGHGIAEVKPEGRSATIGI